jgi:hypothetical protein
MLGICHVRTCVNVVLVCCAAACIDQAATTEAPSFTVASVTADALGARPALGWSSFDVLSTSRSGYGQTWLDEAHIKAASDVMQQKLQSAGYEYINIDSGWSVDFAWTRNTWDAYGVPLANAERFPSGIAGIAAYVHAKAQKLGIYGVVGLPSEVYNGNYPIEGTQCHAQDIARQPLTTVPNGWYGQYEIDWSNSCAQAYYNSVANRFASWGVDLLKVDGTTADNGPDIKAWQAAIAQTGRPMWLTVSAWPVPLSLGAEIRQVGQSVRVDTDIDCYCSTISSWTASVNQRWIDLPKWLPYVGPGHFPDLDSMPVSNNTGSGVQDGLNDVERQSVMSFWSMASSPLWVGGDIWYLDAGAVSILTNPEVIAVDQAAVIPQQIVGGNQQQWKKTMPDGALAVGVFNLGDGAASIQVDFASLGLSGDASVRDLVARADLGTFTGSFTAVNVPAHGSRLLKVTAENDGIAGYTFCSSEYQNCTLSGMMDVAYGAQGQYAYKSGLNGTFYCSNATFGSDPAYGATKGCYVRASGGGGPASFTFCAGQGQSCSPSGAVDVAYGAVGQFQFKTDVVGGVGCGDGTFGDPAYGWTKACYTRPSGGGVAYEAEAASVAGAAKIASCAGCGGGKKIGYLGAGSSNRVTFPQVDVASSGDHTLFVHGVSADLRTFTISVNGGASIVVGLQGRDWSTPAVVSVHVPLVRGVNTIVFTNGNQYAPDLDRIVVW